MDESSKSILSWVAMDRLLQQEIESNPKYRRELEVRGKPLLSQARKLSDQELLDQLRDRGIDIDRAAYAKVAEHALSAEEVCGQFVTEELRSRFEDPFDEDVVWMALAVLWERWFPQWPNFEQLDDRIQAGYRFLDAEPAVACKEWVLAWESVLALFEKGQFKSIQEFDRKFRGTQCIFNWVQDFEMALSNAGITDPAWLRRCVEFCEQFLQRFASEDDLLTENMRRAFGQALFNTGERARSDALFKEWLDKDPQWGWGWIGWHDCYAFSLPKEDRDLQRAEAILKQGLAVPGVRDRVDILDRLGELYKEQGRHEEAVKTHFECEVLRGLERRANSQESLDAEREPVQVKVGRNDPCPCGSGKKYKKCCLPKDETRGR